MRRNLLAASALLLWGAALTASAVAQQPVKLGVLNDQTGLYSDLSGMGSVHASRMAVEDFGGKVLGRPIEVIFADHQNKPDIGANIARQWIETEGVTLILDVPNSAVGLAVREVTRTRDAVDINTGAATSDLTGKACSPHGVHWSFDTYGLAATIGQALVKQGGDSWFFVTADYAFGHALEKDTSAFVTAAGGKVAGAVRHPLNTADFSSFLLQAQASKAKIVALANAGGDTINAIKQAGEFGLGRKGDQRVAALLLQFPDTHALGLEAAQGLTASETFFWDLERRHPRLDQAPRRAQCRETAEHDPCRDLRRDAALPQGGGGSRHDRCDQGGRQDEGTADRRLLHQGHGARGWTRDAALLSAAGQEALGIQIPVRLSHSCSPRCRRSKRRGR